MRPGVWNLLFGLVAVAFGLSKQLGDTSGGSFVLLGTNSSGLLVGAGALVAFIGVIQLLRSRGK